MTGTRFPLQSTDLSLEIAAGNVTGRASINKFGENLTITKNTTEDIWDGGGTYSFPSTADITHISQAVDQVAMRAAVIEVQGLDTNWAQVTQTKALDGSNTTTAVALNTALRRVFRMRVLANVVGAQDISAKNVGGGTVYATIQTGNNQTLMAIYTVPAGKTAFMTNYFGDQIPDNAGIQDPNRVEYKIWAADRDNGYEFQLTHSKATTAAKSEFQHFFNPYLQFAQKTDIKMTGTPSSDKDGHVHAGFDLILLDDN